MPGVQLTVPTLERAPDPGVDHGEVFTRRWVAELILDLAGYRATDDLSSTVVVEPSCGTGAFLVPIVERLLECVGPDAIGDLDHVLRAYDLLEANTVLARQAVLQVLQQGEVGEATASRLVESWISAGDFLLDDLDLPEAGADLVVGNPPYVRLEAADAAAMASYRQAFDTMRGRSDLYVGFFERGLQLLADGGRLAFICADRWMRNQYGARLREFVTNRFAVDMIVSMHDVDAFADEVSAYPAITILGRAPQDEVLVAETTAGFDGAAATDLARIATNGRKPTTRDVFRTATVPSWPSGTRFWPSGDPTGIALVRQVEERLEPLENDHTGTRVGIGVATGADRIYLTDDADVAEPDRLLPIVTSSDISGGEVAWSGHYLVNPWTARGLVDLDDHPRLAAYYRRHERTLRGRHVARRQPQRWYRTIDRVDPQLQDQPKLLLPDLKAAAHPVLDTGGFHPHHNLYYVVSDHWDLEVLGGLLLSDITNLFIGTYCVKMRGGTYRFQAQYLRTVRVPDPGSIESTARHNLRMAFRRRDRDWATRVACGLYGLDPEEVRAAIHRSNDD